METHETHANQEDEEIARAKESLMARMEELNRRFQSAKHKLDLEAHIAAHPIASVGVALAAGLLLGSHGARRFVVEHHATDDAHPEPAKATPFVSGLLVSLLVGAVKDFAFGQLTEYAKSLFSPPSEQKVGNDM
jgi:hypothetical protein